MSVQEGIWVLIEDILTNKWIICFCHEFSSSGSSLYVHADANETTNGQGEEDHLLKTLTIYSCIRGVCFYCTNTYNLRNL